MNPKLWARVAHLVDGKAVHQRPAYYKAKKTRGSTLKPKAITHFRFNNKKPTLPTTPAVRMVAPAPEEEPGEGEAIPVPSEESDIRESYEATPEDTTISQGDIEIAVRVAQASETFTG